MAFGPSSTNMFRFDPNRPDFAPYGFTCVRWAPTPMRRPDRHNEIERNFLGRGWLAYLLGGRKIRVEAGHLSAFWAAMPHQILDYGGETDYFVATLPLVWFLQCKLPDGFVHALLHGHPADGFAAPDSPPLAASSFGNPPSATVSWIRVTRFHEPAGVSGA